MYQNTRSWAFVWMLCGWASATLATCPILAQDATQTTELAAAEGKLVMQVPATWSRKQPSIRMIEHEFEIRGKADDAATGRLTMMMAGGSVQANLDRWKGQFRDIQGDKDKQLTKLEASGMPIHLLDVQGTYMDQRGPFAPAVPRSDYRMLGAVVEVKGGGLFFVKFYGPAATIDDNADAFRTMLTSIQPK